MRLPRFRIRRTALEHWSDGRWWPGPAPSGSPDEQPGGDEEHLVAVYLDGDEVASDRGAWERFLAALDDAVTAAGAGEVDDPLEEGREGEVAVYAYGPDADALFAAVRPVLDGFRPSRRVELRRGDVGAPPEVIRPPWADH